MLLGADIADAVGVLSHAVELFAVPSEPAQERQSVRYVLDTDRGRLGLLEVEAGALVRTDGAVGRLDCAHRDSMTISGRPSSFSKVAILVRRALITSSRSLRVSLRLANPLANFSSLNEYQLPDISKTPRRDAYSTKLLILSKPAGRSVPGYIKSTTASRKGRPHLFFTHFSRTW